MFDSFKLELLNDAFEQMSEKKNLDHLSRFKQLSDTALNNEGWFEWELFDRLLKVDRGWIRAKKNRKKPNRKRGDGVDLQFDNNRFIELRAVTTKKTNMPWVIMGLTDHGDADAVIFLALNHPSLNRWLTANKKDDRIQYKSKKYDIKFKPINNDWIVGIMKKIK